MKRIRYSTEQLTFLKENFPKMSVSDLTIAFNRRFKTKKTPGQIKSTLKNHQIRCGRSTGEMNKGQYKLLTPDQVAFLKITYKNHPFKETTRRLNEHFNITLKPGQVRWFCQNHGIRSGRSGQFKTGKKPWNIGTKGVMKPNSGNFKKGSIPPNLRPIGSERICKKDGFVLIKIREENPYTGHDTRFKHKHVHIYEQHHGPVPDGFVVAFIDGDKLNCEPDNLMLISRAELLRLNKHGYKDMPDELKPSIRALIKMETRMFERAKEARP